MRVTLAATALAAAIAIVTTAYAHSYKLGDLQIGHPWSRATLPNAPVAGGYMTIENTGTSDDTLLGGSTPAAGKVEIHQMKMDGDVMTMRPVENGLVIPAGQTVTLEPGGYHLMLVKPQRPFKEGERVPLTLKFEKAGEVDVELAVDKPNATGKTDHAGHGGMGAMQTQ
ncbi:copper chaperone PCu(A)C [Jiella avicenniae]|uniref:Copper chaperone PCu(A)C n=1 Tax=Jiella avicenniae TaxID=2907202 RepID=A0A9X1T2U1_9HYPH|nr:copper chaperone PCu(A)C [Jiella avicenniae]MCE7026591.1 copper chaperone PCu(A)C [Jiella avicenniae]